MTSLKTFCRSAVLLCLLFMTAQGAEDSIEGYWQGAIVRDGAAQIIGLEFFKEASALKGKLEIPDLLAFDTPPFPVSFEGGKVQFDSPLGKTTLKLDAEVGELIGTVGEATPPIQAHLKRSYRLAEIPIRTEDVEFRNGAVTLAGTLVTPATPGPHPAIVWIHGRGKSARRGFLSFARILAQRGVASLIYDKRGVGKSTGDHDKAAMLDFVGDALSALDFLATRREIDRKQIGLHATSAGGWVAAIVATRTKIPLAFIVTNVGPAESVRDQQVHVAKHTMLQSGINFTPEEYAAAARHMNLIEDFAYTGKGWEALRASVAQARLSRWARFVDLPESESYEDIVWVHLNQYDPAPDLKKIAVPFLALYGGSDYVVPPEENVKKLEQYLTEAGNRDFKIIVYPNSDHGLTIPSQLRRVAGEQPEKYYWLWRKKAPGVVGTTVDWILQHVTLAQDPLKLR